MPLEKSDYRPILVGIKEQIPDKQILSVKDVVQITGKSRHWVTKHIRFGIGNTVHVESLAEQLCSETEAEAQKRRKQEDMRESIRNMRKGATYGQKRAT